MRSRLNDSLAAFRRVFASRSLRRLQLALAGSVIGDYAFSIAMAVYAFEAGGATAVGLLTLVRFSAAGLLAPFTSVLADRHPRRSVMIAADAIRMVAVAIAAAVVWADGPSLIVYAAPVVTAIVFTAFQPAQTAMLPSLTEGPEELTAANVVT